MACWVIGYGVIQGLTPQLVAAESAHQRVVVWSAALAGLLLAILFLLVSAAHDELTLVVGLLLFGAAFAVTSALHSYLILAYADDAGVTLDVGFYYMANAGGRLFGTLLSGLLYQWAGTAACIGGALLCTLVALVPTGRLPAPTAAALSRVRGADVGD